MDPASIFQTAASAVAVCETLMKVYKALSNFINGIKNADRTAADLRSKVKQLYGIIKTVKKTLKHCAAQRTIGPPEQDGLLREIRTSLESCKQNLKRFEGELAGLLRNSRYDWPHKALLQAKLQGRKAAIIRFEKNMDTQIMVLSILLQCHQAFTQNNLAKLQARIQQTRLHIYNKSKRIQPCSRGLEVGNSSRDSGDGFDDCREADESDFTDDENRNVQDLERTIKSASLILSMVPNCRSEHESSTKHSGDMYEGPNTTVDEDDVWLEAGGPRFSEDDVIASAEIQLVRSQDADAIDDLSGESDSYFDNFLPREVLEDCINGYMAEINSKMETKEYAEAEKAQRKRIGYLNQREVRFGLSFNKVTEEERLAKILTKQRNFFDASIVYYNLLNKGMMLSLEMEQVQDLETRLTRSRQYYAFAKLHCLQYDITKNTGFLDDSMTYAMYSFHLRQKILNEHDAEHDADFQKSVRLLVNIFTQRGDNVEAQSYIERYLRRSPVPEGIMPSPVSQPSPECTPFAAIEKQDVRVLQQLLNGGIDVEMKGDDGNTLLMHAVAQNNAKAVRLLMSWGASLNAVNTNGLTPLFLAIKEGNCDVTESLLNHGAAIESQTATKATPLLYAIQSGQSHVVNTLLTSGANVRASDQEGWTCLHHAVHGPDSTNVIAALLSYGADVNAPSSRSRETPLHFAVTHANYRVARYLLDKDADINAVDSAGDTPLHIAVGEDNYDLVKLLLVRGAIYRKPQPGADSSNGIKVLPKDLSRRIKALLKEHKARRRQEAPDATSLATESSWTTAPSVFSRIRRRS